MVYLNDMYSLMSVTASIVSKHVDVHDVCCIQVFMFIGNISLQYNEPYGYELGLHLYNFTGP